MAARTAEANPSLALNRSDHDGSARTAPLWIPPRRRSFTRAAGRGEARHQGVETIARRRGTSAPRVGWRSARFLVGAEDTQAAAAQRATGLLGPVIRPGATSSPGAWPSAIAAAKSDDGERRRSKSPTRWPRRITRSTRMPRIRPIPAVPRRIRGDCSGHRFRVTARRTATHRARARAAPEKGCSGSSRRRSVIGRRSLHDTANASSTTSRTERDRNAASTRMHSAALPRMRERPRTHARRPLGTTSERLERRSVRSLPSAIAEAVDGGARDARWSSVALAGAEDRDV
jgi:hypothetical protein